MNQLPHCIVLAAGKSTRLHTGRTKLVETICGQEMIIYTTKLLERLQIPTTVVVGYDKKNIINSIKANHKNPITFVEQKEQLGTGHALKVTKNFWDTEDILVLNGDTPLITPDIIENLYVKHNKNNAAISFVISHTDNIDNQYGRVFTKNASISIIETKDMSISDPRLEHPWINAGIYLINTNFLRESITKLTQNNMQNEFYITDLVNIANKEQKKIFLIKAPFDTIRGINTFEELTAVEQIKRLQLAHHWMEQGVRFSSPKNTHIDVNVSIGAGSFIGYNVHLRGTSIIGKNCYLHEFSSIKDSFVGNNVTIYSHCLVNKANIANNTQVKPFSYINDTKNNFHEEKIIQKNSKGFF